MKIRITSKNCPTRKFLVSNAAFLREYFGGVIRLLAYNTPGGDMLFLLGELEGEEKAAVLLKTALRESFQ